MIKNQMLTREVIEHVMQTPEKWVWNASNAIVFYESLYTEMKYAYHLELTKVDCPSVLLQIAVVVDKGLVDPMNKAGLPALTYRYTLSDTKDHKCLARNEHRCPVIDKETELPQAIEFAMSFKRFIDKMKENAEVQKAMAKRIECENREQASPSNSIIGSLL